MIKGKSPEEIRKLFNIINDFTPEEEAQIRRENVSTVLVFSVFMLTSLYRNGLKTANCKLHRLITSHLPLYVSVGHN